MIWRPHFNNRFCAMQSLPPLMVTKSKAVSPRVSAPPSKPHARGCESLFDRLLNLVEDAHGHASDNDCSDAGQQKNLHDKFTSMDSNWPICKVARPKMRNLS
jgi:hypothetical protein